jgi:hypothetical protein
MKLAITLAASLLAAAALAAAAAIPPSPARLFTRTAGKSAVDVLLGISPNSNTCDGAPFPAECATAEHAAPFLTAAMEQYGVRSLQELAAVLSLIAFETGDFKFNVNHYPAPGRPGQGTRNMQMAQFNLDYASSIPALAPKLRAITTSTTIAGLTDDQLNDIRALVLADQYTWGSAAWFLTTQCANIRPQLQAGGQAGWSAYLACIGTTATSDRLAYWQRANTAFGIS